MKLSTIGRPTATTAATTAFCAARVEGPDGFLWIDGNGKITRENGTLAEPKPNAFSLVQIEDCPGATAVCKASCYVHGLEKHAPDTHALYRHNSEKLRAILDGRRERASDWATALADWIAANCAGGFRWHVSGDVFSATYARWISEVVKRSPNVAHWIYTRSFEHVAYLAGVEKLTVNLSCDSENYLQAVECSEKFGGLRLCYLTHDGRVPVLFSGDVIFPDYSLRGGTDKGAAWFEALSAAQKKMVCPVDYHGKSEERRCGPCDRCLI